MKKKRFFASMLALVLLLFCVSFPSAAFAEGAGTSPDGLVLSKTATATGNGNYKIRLEAYTTGTVTTTTSTVPVDIVLVLDQSGSMAYDFNGNLTDNDQDRRQYALKQAVNNFIGAVNEKYDAADADHRMAIVTFGSGSNASTLQDWTYVDTNGKNILQGEINRLPNSPSGATNAGAGMEQAEALMGSGYNYTGNNTTRQKVVVFFTDGVPTTSSDFDTDVANTAITAAKKMKDSGVTVFSIGIFSGANPDEMYGASGFDTNSNGTINSKWIKDTWGLFPGTDFPEADRPAANRFLNLLSSNFQNATEIGLERKTGGFGILHYKITYTITSNFDRTANNYYLTADNAASLNGIFQEISQNIQTADISLDSSTVVKDIISPYFTAPANTNDIKVYTAAYQGGNTWGEDTPISLSPTVNNSSVTVTGFDFNANFIAEDLKDDGTRGNKLVIEFTVAPKEGFLGGNNVPTNGADSGVYGKEGTAVGLFEQPTVNVPIKDVTVKATDKNVYLKGEVTADQLKDGSEISVGDVTLDLTRENYGLEGWQTEYVDITVTVKDKDGNVISDKLDNLTDDTTYTVEVTVSPKTAGTSTSEKGDAATAKTGVNDPAANIYVFKPELTFKDSTAYYGESIPTSNDYSGNKVGSETWKHGDTVSTNVTMLGTQPTLDITYTPDESKLKGGKYTKQDVPVAATVNIGTENVNAHTTFVHQDCAGKTCTLPENYHFWIHIQTCTLEIKKTGGNADEPYVFTVRKDGEKYSEVTVWGNGSETIYELPVGTYTIQEDTGWSWRYTADNGGSAALTAQNPTGSITCINKKNNNQWLNGFSDVEKNIFGVSHNNHNN